ncbi:MAG: ABC transporter substrate-binding protein, partial [Bradyrhizobium sp.]
MTSKSLRVLIAAGLTAAVSGTIASGPASAAEPEIMLGAIVPSSGPFAEWGRTNTATLQMLEKQVNDAGGIKGAKLRIMILDDGTKPAQATNDLRTLAGDDHVLAVAGPLTSSAAEVTFPVANEMKVVST